MSGITTLCFAASYAVALGLELARLGWRSRVRGALAIGFATAGLAAETLYLGYRTATVESVPLASAYEWYLLAAWTLAAVYLYFAVVHPATASGLFILPLALALVAAAQFASKEPFAQTRAAPVWAVVHGTFMLLGAVAVIVGFAAGVMYLLKANWLKHKLPSTSRLRLPSLEWLERANGRAIVVSVLMIGAGLVSGIMLNLVKNELPWDDPTIWRSMGLFGWLLAAALFNALYRPAQRGRKVAYLTVANFVFLALFLAAQLFGRTGHAASEGRVAAAGTEVRGQMSEVGTELANSRPLAGSNGHPAALWHTVRPLISELRLPTSDLRTSTSDLATSPEALL
jgi:ABC-type uncharacterized transport system permease subunit